MHLLHTVSQRPPEIRIGRKYQVLGYHTGDFIGECVELDLHVAVFVVWKNGVLKRGEKVEVQISSARRHGIRIVEI